MIEAITSGVAESTIALLSQWAGALQYLGLLIGSAAVGVITASNVRQGSSFYRADIIAATTDTTASIPHGLGATGLKAAAPFRGLGPQDVTLTPRLAAFFLSQWRVVSVDTTNVNLVKNTTSLSGSASIQMTLTVSRPHSVSR